MSIQSSVNKGLAIGAALATQIPEVKEAQKIKGVDAKIESLTELNKTAESTLKKQIETIQTSEPKGKAAKKVKALQSAHKDLTADTNAELLRLEKQKGSLTGDYNAYLERFYSTAIEQANAKAQQKKAVKVKQAQKVKDLFDVKTNLGVSLNDLNLTPEQAKNIKEQLKGNK